MAFRSRHCRVTKRIANLLVAAVCVCFGSSASRGGDLFTVSPGAANAFTPETFRMFNSSDLRFPWLTLTDSPLTSITTAMTSIRASSAPQRPIINNDMADAKDSLNNFTNYQPTTYVGGEMGFLYGRSAGGKHSFDTEQGYIFGEVGNGNIQVSVGASYERWNTRGRGHW